MSRRPALFALLTAVALLVVGCSSGGGNSSAARVACHATLGNDNKSVALKLVKGASGSISIAAYNVRYSIVAAPLSDGFGRGRASVTGPELGKGDVVEGSVGSSRPGFGGGIPTPEGLFDYGCGGP
jgi:hypothetical protein